MIRKQRLLVFGLVSICLAVMFFGWWGGSGHELTSHATRLVAIGRLAGIVAAAAVLLELFVMSRAPIIENNFDLEEINEFHRYNGYVMTYALITHLVFLVMGYGITNNLGWWSQFVQLNTGFEDVLKATIGSVVFFTVAITSLHLVRHRLPYEVWYFIHILVYGGVLLAFGHQINSGGDIITQHWMKLFWIGIYGLVFGLVLYYRFARHILLSLRHGFRVDRIEEEAPGIYSVYITGREIAKYRFVAGQYAHWRFLSPDLFLESHPFSFSSSPGANELRFTFKTNGDFTKQLVGIQPGTAVFIDGPRGSFTAKRAQKNNVLMIAGGIGVAPYIPIAKSLLREGKTVQVLYSVRNDSELAFVDEFNALIKAAHNRFAVSVHESEDRGRINEIVLSNYIDGYEDKLTVYMCGPDPMTTAVKRMLPDLGLSKSQIVAERFMF